MLVISLETDLVESPGLPVPLFDTVQRRLASQVKHEQDGHRVIGYERQHRDEFPLTAEIPYLVEEMGKQAFDVVSWKLPLNRGYAKNGELTEKVISVLRMLIDFSIKFTPNVWI